MLNARHAMRFAAFGAALFSVGASVYAQSYQFGGSNWPCEALLCMANPNGPTAVSECHPSIRKLYDHLRRGRPFPSCPGSNMSFQQGGSCPPQYTLYQIIEGQKYPIGCKYSASITIPGSDGKPMQRIWLNPFGNERSVVEHLTAESRNLPGASDQFEREKAEYEATVRRAEEEEAYRRRVLGY